jgi:amino acid efflux transporter
LATSETGRHGLGLVRGSALYIGALVGPGLLLVPALAVQAAGAASIVAWAALLMLSAPLALTFAALGVRHPVAGGVSAYVREGLGDAAAAVTGVWFLAAVLLGAPTVSFIGGYYVADLTGSGTAVASLVGPAMFLTVVTANAFGLRISSGFQLALAAVLVVVMAIALAVTLPSRMGDNWTPFTPHGWWAVGTAANILVWLFVGWEAVAQLAGDFRRPAPDLPRAIGLAFTVVTVIYVGLAVATIGVTAGTASRVPLADLISVGFGRVGRDATAVLAVALTMGTMNVYLGGAAKLAATLAGDGVLPAWLAGGGGQSMPRRPLVAIAVIAGTVLLGLLVGVSTTTDLVRATSALFIAVYLLAIASAIRILDGHARLAAIASLGGILGLAAFSTIFLTVPLVAAAIALVLRRALRSPTRAAAPPPSSACSFRCSPASLPPLVRGASRAPERASAEAPISRASDAGHRELSDQRSSLQCAELLSGEGVVAFRARRDQTARPRCTPIVSLNLVE